MLSRFYQNLSTNTRHLGVLNSPNQISSNLNPPNLNKIYIEAEFEQFYHGLLKGISNIPEENLSTLKTKLRIACEKYTRIKVPHKYQQTVKKLSKNKNIVIMKQDKGHGVVIMDKSKYQEKCLMILENDNFKMIDHDQATNFTENEKQIITKRMLMFIPKWILSRQALWNS